MSTNFDYEMHGGPAFSTVEINLKDGEQILAEGGAMSYMDGSVQMETSAAGGFVTSLKRKFSGESFFINTFTGPGMVALASHLPGDIVPLNVLSSDEGWVLTKDAYIGGSINLKLSSKWGGFKSMLGGEGAFLTHVKSLEGEGMFFAGGYGFMKKHDIPAGKEFVVDTGQFFATSDNTQFKISKVGGKKSFFFGGEGLVMRFFGPCVVYTQSRDAMSFIDFLSSKLKLAS